MRVNARRIDSRLVQTTAAAQWKKDISLEKWGGTQHFKSPGSYPLSNEVRAYRRDRLVTVEQAKGAQGKDTPE